MEVRLHPYGAEKSGLPTPDTFVAMRVGDQRQQARLTTSRTFVFSKPPEEGKGSMARLEIFQRIGFANVRLDAIGDSGAEVEIPYTFGGSAANAPEDNKLCIRLFTQNAAKVAPVDKTSRAKKRREAAQQYLDDHQLEDLLADAMNEVIKHKPIDPESHLSKRIMSRSVSDSKLKFRKLPPEPPMRPTSAAKKLDPIDKGALSEPAQKAVAPAPPPPPVVEKPPEEKPKEDVREKAKAMLLNAKQSGALDQALTKIAKAKQPVKEESMKLYFNGNYYEADHEQFKVGVKDGLKDLGCSEENLQKVTVELSPGSIVADVRGPSDAMGAVKGCELDNLSVMGLKAFTEKDNFDAFVAAEAAKAAEPAELSPAAMEQFEQLGVLGCLSKEERLENLGNMDNMSAEEKSALLEAPGAVQSMMDEGGTDELTILLGGKSSQDIKNCHSLWDKLESGAPISFEDLQGVDLKYTDAAGNNALHMMKTGEQAQVLLEGEAGKQLMEIKNHEGKTAVASVMKAVSGTPDGAAMVKVLADQTPSALSAARADGSVMLVGAEAECCAPAVAWPEVREVLLSDSVETFLERLDAMTKAVQAARPSIDVKDPVGFWTEILFDHCFGSVVEKATSSGGAMEHTDLSKERLLDAFKAIEMVMYACSDPNCTGERAKKLGGVIKGLLTVTRGPDSPPFDPREPYRKQFVALVRKLQQLTAGLLSEVMETALKIEPDAVQSVGSFPKDELHGVENSGDAVRNVKKRLRMDSLIVEGDQLAAEPLETPEWVLGQFLNLEAWNGLKRSGAIEMPADIVKISKQGGDVSLEGFTEDRVRFSRLHAAWMRGYCNDRQALMNQELRKMLEIKGDTANGPVEAAGGAKVRVFRCRTEAKGVDRILEKMSEAMEEEMCDDRSRSILTEAGQEDEKKALRELLTPACYVCDINGAEVIVDTFAELNALYKSLRNKTMANDGSQVVRTKNGFSSKIPTAVVNAKGGYRDLKLWVSVKIEDRPLAAELQLHVRGYYDLKSVMHLPYECSRGSFDHAHLATLWKEAPPPVKEEAPVVTPTVLPERPRGIQALMLPSVGTWLLKKPKQRETPDLPDAPAVPTYRNYALKPSVGTWHTLPIAPFTAEELAAFAEDVVEQPVVREYSSYAMRPSVGTWLTLPMAPFTDEELAAFAEQEPKDPWFTKPSVASWLQKVPPEVERPWFFEDPADFGEHAGYIAKLQKLLAEKDRQLDELQRKVEEAAVSPR